MRLASPFAAGLAGVFGLGLALAAPAPARAADADSDGVPDVQDNCLGVANPNQMDGDRDGFGNQCDPDFSGDGAVGAPDFQILSREFGQADTAIDLTGDGIAGIDDLVLMPAAFGTTPGPSGLACAGSVPCACDAPILAPPEEVLAGDVELRWEAPAGFGLAVERRRAAGGTWTPVGEAGQGSTVFVDGAAEPGGYEYRVRASCSSEGPPANWSEYSNTEALELPAECAGQPGFDPALPVVPIGDLDADARYTGADVALALRECGALGGCVLEALPETYEDVSISISNGDPSACGPEFLHCLAAPLAFPKGLVIQGHGSRSVFRSPLWPAGYANPQPLLELWKRPDIRVRLRNLTLDGRKAEQIQPTTPHNTWFHAGFHTWNEWGDHSQRNTDGCLHNLTVRGFFKRGVGVSDTAGWIVEDSAIEDMGCYEGVTPCPNIAGTGSPDPVAGYGVQLGSYNDDLVVQRNELRRIGKDSIALNAGADPTEILRRPRILYNAIIETGSIGILVANLVDGVVQGNRIESTHRPGHPPSAFDSFGIQVAGVVQNTQVVENEILGSAGLGLTWQASGAGNLVADNLLDGSCREKNPDTCVPCSGGTGLCCYTYPDLNVSGGSNGDLRLANNVVQNSLCAMPLGVHWGASADVVVHGGFYESGPKAVAAAEFESVAVEIQGGAVFRSDAAGECVDFLTSANGPTIAVVTSSVYLVGCDPSYEVEPGSIALVCSEDPLACAHACAGTDPPEWCDY